MYAAQYYGKSVTISSFDALDDLGLVKNYKIKSLSDGQSVVDLDSLPHLKADSADRQSFYSAGKMHGYLLGCVKALVLRVEALENQLKEKQTSA